MVRAPPRESVTKLRKWPVHAFALAFHYDPHEPKSRAQILLWLPTIGASQKIASNAPRIAKDATLITKTRLETHGTECVYRARKYNENGTRLIF
ncbi:hypothetical protein PM082_002155 [Marasmius tenuissimus]|nr:hypothetical protein PM082_002155 [Marasmius tenuissimus]